MHAGETTRSSFMKGTLQVSGGGVTPGSVQEEDQSARHCQFTFSVDVCACHQAIFLG